MQKIRICDKISFFKYLVELISPITLYSLIQLHFTGMVYSYKTHILAEAQQYAEVPTGSLEVCGLHSLPLQIITA